MKYFTRTWATGELVPDKAEEVRRAYWAHVDGLLCRLPTAVTELATAVSLHDAIVRQVVVDRCAAALRIVLRCGDAQVGYFDADLRYSGIPLDETDTASLKERAADQRTEVLYDEVDVDQNGYLCHRLLFWPDGELEIRFTAFAIERVRRNNRIEPRVEDVYSEGRC